ncbi:MAG TPA: hydrogenase [Desulfobulbus sp.]|nr:hydrogenase [Desulfobulbus sp.]
MSPLLWLIFLPLTGGLAAVIDGRSRTRSAFWAQAGLLGGLTAAVRPVFSVLSTGTPLAMHLPWAMAGGNFQLMLDPLSAFFLLPVVILGPLFALYGAPYMRHYPGGGYRHGVHWLFYNLLAAGMILVLLARNGLLFMLAWEVMSLAPFFLVLFHDREKKARFAAWVYLVAGHLGGILLLLFFLLLGTSGHSLDFSTFQPLSLSPFFRHLLFGLAFLGFGVKAGILPVHVWLPEAHPAAPSHVSAYMSGVMIKMGIYGILRAVLLLGGPVYSWGMILVMTGVVSGILGVLFALAQHDLKRLLAYHSVENIGIILLGLGTGMIGISQGRPLVAVFGLAGGLLHVLNHSLFKGMLFLGAGSIQHQCTTLEIDELGGLKRRMPKTAFCFLIGSAAICGLPPLNGFISEFLIYVGAVHGQTILSAATAWPLLLTLAGLALIGGLAAACFVKAYGVIFLGSPRSSHAEDAGETGASMYLPMGLLAALCIGIGLAAPLFLHLVRKPVGVFLPAFVTLSPFADASHQLKIISLVGAGVIALGLGFGLFRYLLLRNRPIRREVTWGCGYQYPNTRMQYTASSFARPITLFFDAILRSRVEGRVPGELVPARIGVQTNTPDPLTRFCFRPLFAGIAGFLGLLRWMQHGRVQLYILYIVTALFLLLAALAEGWL